MYFKEPRGSDLFKVRLGEYKVEKRDYDGELAEIHNLNITKKRETEKAVCFHLLDHVTYHDEGWEGESSDYDSDVWIPKSQINEMTEEHIIIPLWLAREKCLVDYVERI